MAGAANEAGLIRVVVAGYGRLGAELARGLAQARETELAGIARRTTTGDQVDLGGRSVPVSNDLPALLDQTRPQALVEASLPQAALGHVRAALERRIPVVIATSGLDNAVPEIRARCQELGVGAV